MTSGSCFCGKIRVSFAGDSGPLMICHCLDCRKISGAPYTMTIVIPVSNFKIEQGTPKVHVKTADSGQTITNNFCPDCGTTLFRTGACLGDSVGIKAGIIDNPDWASQNVPTEEIYVENRVDWVAKIENAKQTEGMS